LVEPIDSLAKRLLLGELVVLVAQIRTNGETVGDATVQVQLPVLSSLDQDLLRLVTESGCEDVINF
jgi:hypothetical protein